MLKVRSFKSTNDHRPFLSKFDVKLESWGMIHTSENRPLEVSTKPLQLLPGTSAGFTSARNASLMGWMGGWVDGVDVTEDQMGSSIFFMLWRYIERV